MTKAEIMLLAGLLLALEAQPSSAGWPAQKSPFFLKIKIPPKHTTTPGSPEKSLCLLSPSFSCLLCIFF